MRDLSLHLLDLAENAIRAEAGLIQITIREDLKNNWFEMTIEDNGKGMDAQMLNKVTDPFTTSRTTRKVGLGIPLMKDTCERAGGRFRIDSEPGKGTKVQAEMVYDHIDRPPLGNIIETLISLLLYGEKTDIIYRHYYDDRSFCFSTIEIKEMLSGAPIDAPQVLAWAKEYLFEQMQLLRKETQKEA